MCTRKHMDIIKEILMMLGRVAGYLVVIFLPIIIVIIMNWVETRFKR